MKKNLDINVIKKDYLACKNAAQVARRHNVCGATITKHLLNAGISTRHIVKNKKLSLSKKSETKLIELIDGLLLGDACLSKTGSLRLEQSSKRRKWLIEVSAKLEIFGVSTRISKIIRKQSVLENRLLPEATYDLLYTKNYIDLKDQRMRWYGKGYKKIPSDINLTPLVLANWFAGDGTYDKKGTLKFCTDGFTKKEVLFLISKLKSIFNVQCNLVTERKRYRQYKIAIYRRDEAVKFKKIINQYLSSCCFYKLKYVRKTLRGEQVT